MSKKTNFEFILKYSKENNNICVSNEEEYKNLDSKLAFICNKCNKKYNTKWRNFYYSKTRCPDCSPSKKKTIEEIKEFTLKQNNTCISEFYINSHELLDFKCENEHHFKMRWYCFFKGSRCPKCKNKQKKSIKYINNFLKNENIKCISEEYINNRKKLKFICSENHKFNMSWTCIQRGQRCPICKGINFSKRITGNLHPNYNNNRKEVLLNSSLRRSFKNKWIVQNMKDDPNYKNYLLNPKDYVIDHIIPIDLFCKLIQKYNLNDQIIKDIINQRSNIQLLTKKQNHSKFNKGSSLFEATQYLINNGISFETFLEENRISNE